jgi:hypothetical protein
VPHSVTHVSVDSIADYNALLLSIEFWHRLARYHRVLMFQTDSEILRDGVEPFLAYDYVGAPFAWDYGHPGGNGGLSIRNPAAMLRVIRDHPGWRQNEDLCFSSFVSNVAPLAVCERFSCETTAMPGTFGCHAIDAWLTKPECRRIREQYKYTGAVRSIRLWFWRICIYAHKRMTPTRPA